MHWWLWTVASFGLKTPAIRRLIWQRANLLESLTMKGFTFQILGVTLVYAALMKSPRVNIYCILIIQVSGANSIRGWQAAFNDLFKMWRFFKSFFTYRHCSICQTIRLYTSVGALGRRFSIQFLPSVLRPYYIELFQADTKLLEYLSMLDFLFPEFKFFRESFCLSN